MKNGVMTSIVQMEPAVLKNLVQEVKETVAKDIKMPEVAKRPFTSAQLWNIRRNAVTAVSRFGK